MKNKGWPRNLSTAPRGGQSTGPGGGASTCSGGGMSTGVGGGLSTGSTPCYLNIPPWPVFVREIEKLGMHDIAKYIRKNRPDV